MPRIYRRLACPSLLSLALLACGPGEPVKPASQAPAAPVAPNPAPPVKPEPTTPGPVKPAVAEPEPTAPAARPVDEVTGAAVAAAINGFAVDLHRALATRPGNLFVSPASITIAFAMTHAGARGDTAREMAKVFHLGADDVKLREGFAATLAGWSAPQAGVELAVANRLYGEKTVRFESAFLDITRTTFGAPLETADFAKDAEGARARINTWVAERTRDKIKDLLPPASLDELTRLVLVNAVYFKADWHTEFAASATKAADFHAGAGKKTVQMMARSGTLPAHVVADARLKVLELPYQGGYSLVVILPDAKDGLARVEKALTGKSLAAWLAGLRPQEVAVQLPRFRMEPTDSLLLASTLKALGMPSAFDPEKADFTGLAPRAAQIYLAEAYHKAFIAVDEKGTEAAAATAVVATTRGMAPVEVPKLSFVADHPFLFMIRDQKTGAILFMGRLVDP